MHDLSCGHPIILLKVFKTWWIFRNGYQLTTLIIIGDYYRRIYEEEVKPSTCPLQLGEPKRFDDC